MSTARVKGFTVLKTIPSIMANIFMFGFDTIVAVLISSPWLAVMSLYYLVLAVMRIIILVLAGRGVISKDKERALAKNYGKTGLMFIILSFILAGSVCYLADNNVGHTYPGLLIILVLIYTIIKVASSIRSMLIAHQNRSFVTLTLSKIGHVDALVSILVLESAFIYEFSDPGFEKVRVFFTGSGIVIAVIILSFGISCLVDSAKAIKNTEKTQ